MKERVGYFDFLRGIAIIMVIGIHAYILPKDLTISSEFSLLIRQVLNCAVPLFFAISGFFCFPKKLNTNNEWKQFWRRQISKVYIPTIILSLPLYIYSIYSGKNFYISTLRLLICGYSIYYFVAVTIQMYLLLPLLKNRAFKDFHNGSILVSALISFLTIIIVTYVNIIQGMHLPLILYAGTAFLWIIFFILGCKLSTTSRKHSLYLSFFLALAGLIISYYESAYLMHNYRGGVGIKPSSFLFSIGVILLLFSSDVEKFYNKFHNKSLFVFFEKIGRDSFAIYLIHCYIRLTILPFLPFSSLWGPRWFYMLIVSVLIVETVRFLIPKKYRYYIGIYS